MFLYEEQILSEARGTQATIRVFQSNYILKYYYVLVWLEEDSKQ